MSLINIRKKAAQFPGLPSMLTTDCPIFAHTLASRQSLRYPRTYVTKMITPA